MNDFYSHPQQQGQHSSSFYGNSNQTHNQSQAHNQSHTQGQSTSEQYPTNHDSTWEPSSFTSSNAAHNPPSNSNNNNNNNNTYQFQSFQQTTHPTPPNNSSSTHSSNNNNNNAVPKFWNPANLTNLTTAAVSGNNEKILEIGIDHATDFLHEGIARMIPGLNTTMMSLRVYFAVDNSYVKRKMGIVLGSFFHRDWMRKTNDPSTLSTTQYALPHSDDNALDLYIPSMSLITYVLLCALCYGTAGKFSPELLPDIITSCLLTQFVEIIFFKIGLYSMGTSSSVVPLLDLVAITGYKYLGLCGNMLVGIALEILREGGEGSRKGYFVTFLWTASAVGYFVLKTMAVLVPEVSYGGVSGGGGGGGKGPKREFVVLAFGVSQLACMWFLGRTKFLS